MSSAALPFALLVSASRILSPSAARAGEGASAVRMPRVLREGQIDTSSVDSIISSIIQPGMTQRQKALAVYEFLSARSV